MTLEEKVSQTLDQAVAIPRLALGQTDGGTKPSTAWPAPDRPLFPQAIGMAATWDTDLMHRSPT